MATIITEECINCGACEPECPNTAIYQAAMEYDWQGTKHPALSADFFYIVPEKCTECVGFFDHEACAAVCPVDCCIPDPQRPETEVALLDRARQIHPDRDFAEPVPSRFRKGDGAGVVASGNGSAASSSVDGERAASAAAPTIATGAAASAAPPSGDGAGRAEPTRADAAAEEGTNADTAGPAAGVMAVTSTANDEPAAATAVAAQQGTTSSARIASPERAAGVAANALSSRAESGARDRTAGAGLANTSKAAQAVKPGEEPAPAASSKTGATAHADVKAEAAKPDAGVAADSVTAVADPRGPEMGPAMTASSSDGESIPARKKLTGGDPAHAFSNESRIPFEDALRRLRGLRTPRPSVRGGLALLAASPMLGALDDDTKRAIERSYGDHRFFSRRLATAFNIGVDLFCYPIGFYFLGLLPPLRMTGQGDNMWIIFGVLAAALETLLRLRDGIVLTVNGDAMRYGASAYGALLRPLLRGMSARFARRSSSGWIPVEGFYSPTFEPKRERERRYGEVYTVEETDGGYYVRMELPRRIPDSTAKKELRLGDEMPDYDLRVSLAGAALTVRGSVVDPELRAVCGVSPAFPADFKTDIPMRGPLAGFRHRYEDKLLEVVVMRRGV